MKTTCKFCGKEMNGEKYMRPDRAARSCGECTWHCMKKCPIASSPSTSWHKEPCTTCKHNPYNKTPGRAV